MKKEDCIRKYWDDFLKEYFLQTCEGCQSGHSSFWRTIILSEEWKAWKKFNKGGNWDFSECEELGIMSSRHWQLFLEFIKRK